MAYGWQGELVRLVPLEMDRHFENAMTWINDPEVTENVLIGDFPLGRLEEQSYFEKHSKGSRDDVAFAIETLDGKHIGFSGIHNIGWQHRRATTGTIIGDREEWGKGYGTDAARVRAHYAFEVLNLRMLLSECLARNERSFRMQLAAGYKQCGYVPAKYWKRGAYQDTIITYIDRESWEESLARR